MPRAYLSHRAPGRVRLKIPERRQDRRFFTDAAERMVGCEGVLRAEANPLTGSLLLVHSGELAPILEFAREEQIFELAAETVAPVLAERVSAEMEAVSQALHRSTGGQVDVRTALFVVFVAASMVQLLRGRVFGPSSTLLWYASTLLPAPATSGRATEPSDGGGGRPSAHSTEWAH